MSLILGIESSCDETGIAVYNDVSNRVIAESLFSQIEIHQQYGGVMPEIASRNHVKNIIPLLQNCLQQKNLSLKDIDIFSYTAGPGLNGALLVGTIVANTIAYMFNKPSLPIHHLEGHILSPLLDQQTKQLEYPYLVLLVSGGHSQIILVTKVGHYQILGDTLDDAAGEAFDKTAKMLGFSYPGGVEIAKHALLGQKKYYLPRPMLNKKNLDLSFSGLKTACNLLIKKTCQQYQCATATELPSHEINNISFAVEDAITDTLVAKTMQAIYSYQPKTLVVAGGVSANLTLRKKFKTATTSLETKVVYPPLSLCTDNGAMIALAGSYRKSYASQIYSCVTYPRWSLEQLQNFYSSLGLI